MTSPSTNPLRPSAQLSNSLADFAVPGVMVEVDPQEAEELGAFEEPALTAADAWDANADIALFEEGGDDGE